MSEGRSDSRGSPLSQLSESTVLNQDLGDIGLLENDLFSKPGPPRVKVARFDLGSASSSKGYGSYNRSVRLPSVMVNRDLTEELKRRLCAKPENSTVLVNARLQGQRPSSGKESVCY